MKVVVRCAHNRVTKADMEREIERLFQENKDLRVSEGHLRDELNLARQQSSSQDMDTMVDIWKKAVEEKIKAEERAEEYHIALMESDCRVNECEKRMDWLSKEVALLTAERDTSVSENSELIFTINELQDKWEAEHNLRVEAEKAYDRVTSEAYDMHQQITNLTIDNTRLENKVEELEDEVDTCRHNIDGYIEGNRRMRAEYEKKMETEQDQTKYWHKKHDEVLQKMEGYKTQLIVSNNENLARAKAMEQLQEEHNELEENFNELERVHKLWGEEIDRLRRVVTELQTNRFTMGEIQNMIRKYLESFEPSSGSLNF